MPSKAFSIIAGIISIIAGIYLASTRAAGSNSLIETLINGIGWYCIARGIYMISSIWYISRLLNQGPPITSDDTQQCRSCMGYVHRFANKCKHCGSDLTPH